MRTQKSKPQDTQLGVPKIYAFCRKIYQTHLGPGESAAGVHISVFDENTQKANTLKSISPLKVAATLVVQESTVGA